MGSHGTKFFLFLGYKTEKRLRFRDRVAWRNENWFDGSANFYQCLCKISGQSDQRFKSYGPKTEKTHENRIKMLMKIPYRANDK